MVAIGQRGCIQAKMVVIGKVVVFGKIWLYSCKVVVVGQSGCIRVKVVVFRQNVLSSSKIGCIRAKWSLS